jgi:hypothetical protein
MRVINLAPPVPRPEVRRRALDRWMTEQEAAPARRRRFLPLLPALIARPFVLGAMAAVLLVAALSVAWWQHDRKGSGRQIVQGVTPRRNTKTAPSPVAPPPKKDAGPAASPIQRDTTIGLDRRHGARADTGQGSPRLPSPRHRMETAPAQRQSSPLQPREAAPGRQQPSRSAPQVPPIPDKQFLDGRDPSLLARWSPIDGREQALIESILKRLPPPADDFVRIPFPRIAAGPNREAAIAAASREYEQQAKVVDSRLFRNVTLQLKGASLEEFCAQMQAQTGVAFRASRTVADEKVTVFVKDKRAREVMRAVANLFGYFWARSGKDGEYRYELDQDLKSQLVEEELRNRDRHAALLALDEQMQQYRPYVDLSFEQLQKLAEEVSAEKNREKAIRMGNVTGDVGWGGMQLYHRLMPAERAALSAGQELVFRPSAPNPDHGLPSGWDRMLLKSWDPHPAGEEVPLSEIPGARINQVRMRLDRSELGQASLKVWMTAVWQGRRGRSWTLFERALATGRSPSMADPENAKANAALRGQSPFDQMVSLRPEPSCPALKRINPSEEEQRSYGASPGGVGQPHVFTADVWEAVHRETGLPVIADFYTRMHRLDKVTVPRKPLFEALCTVSDALGVRWSRDGDFLLCRGTSYYWDKLKEVPNRLLQRWIASRDANGGLPLADFLEMAALSDQQLDSVVVSEAIAHCWGLESIRNLRHPHSRRTARFFATLTTDQQHRAMMPAGVPIRQLTPTQQQGALQLNQAFHAVMERQFGEPSSFNPEWWARAEVAAEYTPAGWYCWKPPSTRPVPMAPVAARTAEEALAAARRMWAGASPEQVELMKDGWFGCGFRG